MYRAITRFFLALYLFQALVPAPVREELSRLPELGRHYRVHLTLTPQLSFPDFLQLHYGAAFSEHRAEHEHDKLPGKDSHCPCAACFAATPAVFDFPPHFVLRTPAVPCNAPGFFPAETLPRSSYATGIWQPPRTVA